MDIFLNQLIQFYLNNALNLRPLIPHIIPCYTHKMAAKTNGHRYGTKYVIVNPMYNFTID